MNKKLGRVLGFLLLIVLFTGASGGCYSDANAPEYHLYGYITEFSEKNGAADLTLQIAHLTQNKAFGYYRRGNSFGVSVEKTEETVSYHVTGSSEHNNLRILEVLEKAYNSQKLMEFTIKNERIVSAKEKSESEAVKWDYPYIGEFSHTEDIVIGNNTKYRIEYYDESIWFRDANGRRLGTFRFVANAGLLYQHDLLKESPETIRMFLLQLDPEVEHYQMLIDLEENFHLIWDIESGETVLYSGGLTFDWEEKNIKFTFKDDITYQEPFNAYEIHIETDEDYMGYNTSFAQNNSETYVGFEEYYQLFQYDSTEFAIKEKTPNVEYVDEYCQNSGYYYFDANQNEIEPLYICMSEGEYVNEWWYSNLYYRKKGSNVIERDCIYNILISNDSTNYVHPSIISSIHW